MDPHRSEFMGTPLVYFEDERTGPQIGKLSRDEAQRIAAQRGRLLATIHVLCFFGRTGSVLGP
jgi:hypothetical protein